jgi:hypothetical protein
VEVPRAHSCVLIRVSAVIGEGYTRRRITRRLQRGNACANPFFVAVIVIAVALMSVWFMAALIWHLATGG